MRTRVVIILLSFEDNLIQKFFSVPLGAESRRYAQAKSSSNVWLEETHGGNTNGQANAPTQDYTGYIYTLVSNSQI